MIFTETPVPGALVVDLNTLSDTRGFFARAWCRKEFADNGHIIDISQANVSFNKYQGTLRGMHMQKKPHEETKIVSCTKGAVFDVLVDLRPSSPTFKQWYGTELTEDNHRMLVIPEGCAHGYQTLADNSQVFYLVSESYAPDSEVGLLYNDPEIGISWPVPVKEISDKDANNMSFQDVYNTYLKTLIK